MRRALILFVCLYVVAAVSPPRPQPEPEPVRIMSTVEWSDAAISYSIEQWYTTMANAPTTTTRPVRQEGNSGHYGNPWDALAACESGGDWSINTGNSYYGGLQMNMQFWTSYGGFEFAERPDLATREQQIIVAERARDSGRGYRPWPACSQKLGLA